VAGSGVDAEKLDVLRQWANGLERDARVEVAAAGRAILLLIEEIERLHVNLWDKQLYPEVPAAQDLAQSAGHDDQPRLFETLRTRVQQRPTDGFPPAEPTSPDDDFHR
jgi:cytochrome c-type biogenesis protein CcmH/NrfG